eukprot:160034_1
MSVTIQGNTSTVISNNSAPEGTSEIAKITRQIQVLTEKLGKISSEEGMTTQQKKEMAALVQKQIESLWAQLEQLLRQQAEKKNEDATVQPDKKEENKRTRWQRRPGTTGGKLPWNDWRNATTWRKATQLL